MTWATHQIFSVIHNTDTLQQLYALIIILGKTNNSILKPVKVNPFSPLSLFVKEWDGVVSLDRSKAEVNVAQNGSGPGSWFNQGPGAETD